MALGKASWPECISQHMKVDVCKDFIDNEIATLFDVTDQYIKTFIKRKRKDIDPWYNAMEIVMDDSNLVVGRDGDGVVHYPL